MAWWAVTNVAVIEMEAAQRSMIASALKTFYGFCGLVLLGAHCLKGKAQRALSIAALLSGPKAICS